MKKRTVLISILAAAICLSACGGSSGSAGSDVSYASEDKEYAASESAVEGGYGYEPAMNADLEEGAAEDAAAGSADGGSETSALRAQDGQKIVYTGNLSIQTLEYDKSVSAIRKKIKEAGGFTESENENDRDYNWYNYSDSSSHTRTLNLTARIPSDKFESFINSLSGDGKIMSRSVNAENISQVYANKDSYRKALEKEQERLLAMMDKAETIEDMIKVESRLSEVERQLNVYRTDLAQMDKDVEYSTVYIELQEVKRYTQEVNTVSFGERVRYAFEDAVSSFRDFCEGIVLFVVRTFPFLILLGIVIALIIHRIRKSRARRIAMMTDPEYARIVNERARAKAEAAARKRAEKEVRRSRGMFGKKNAGSPAAEVPKDPAAEAQSGEKPGEPG